MSERTEKFGKCKHRHVQDFTEICLDCGENIYTSVAEIVHEELKEKRNKRERENFDKDDTGW